MHSAREACKQAQCESRLQASKLCKRTSPRGMLASSASAAALGAEARPRPECLCRMLACPISVVTLATPSGW